MVMPVDTHSICGSICACLQAHALNMSNTYKKSSNHSKVHAQVVLETCLEKYPLMLGAQLHRLGREEFRNLGRPFSFQLDSLLHDNVCLPGSR